MKLFIVLILSSIATSSWALTRCEVVRAIRNFGIHRFRVTVGDLTCLADKLSGYDESLNRSKTDFGMYQIASQYWCYDGITRSANVCGMNCRDLLNRDIRDDLRCVERIVKDPNGFNAWSAWRACKGYDNSGYEAGC